MDRHPLLARSSPKASRSFFGSVASFCSSLNPFSSKASPARAPTSVSRPFLSHLEAKPSHAFEFMTAERHLAITCLKDEINELSHPESVASSSASSTSSSSSLLDYANDSGYSSLSSSSSCSRDDLITELGAKITHLEKFSYKTEAFRRKERYLIGWLLARFEGYDKLYVEGLLEGRRIIMSQEDDERRLERIKGAKYWESSITEARAFENRIREDFEGRMNVWLRKFKEEAHDEMVRHIGRLRRHDLRDAYLPLPSIWRP
ncbi:tRNA A64-2'-O-ribosylphosphate transferase [Rhodotorula toruloides ATCC 204091]|uniref:tRNA A64-2'-O-ribosylphosphate transferase n=2 Tax=Rhodotorula toruloides TaxID=5286 RepID=A0A2T0AGV7_RHOTO|nr:tRNA A64-2'-O-ribosylphosphate transferase [Rhodotorula toruloides ATCC 204091]PRQ77251.1 tRNA A64-2'-O-ribosylphosphate transferase [Rhodotorula toruloides]